MQSPSITLWQYLRSSTGQKFLMALSGFVLIGFIVGHLLGNLQVFAAPEKINAYSEFLQSLGEVLWIARIGLLFMVGLHIATAVSLTLSNRAARPIAYANKRYIKASYASRTMAVSGFIVLAFIIYHLMHYTLGLVHPQYYHLVDAQGRHDVHSMIVLSFRNPLISLAYIVSIFLLCLHLSHGFSSLFQSLGVNNERLRPVLSRAGMILAWVIFAGYAAIPVGVLAGIVKLAPGVNVP